MPGPDGRLVGRGTIVSGKGDFGGRTVQADDIAAVLALVDTDLSDAILLTDQASATAVAPILPNLAGVICTQGGESAHLAIVSRALALPCMMGAKFDVAVEPGTTLHVDGEGRIIAL
jgi:signal transduction protein with GAF and PtsI domain